MEPGNALRVDLAAMQGFSAALEGAAEGLRSRLSELDAQVGEMLAGWQGGAGGAYGSAWQLWQSGAGEMQLGLSLLARAVGLAGLAFENSESVSAAVVRRVGDG